jgi:hypothetical protein
MHQHVRRHCEFVPSNFCPRSTASSRIYRLTSATGGGAAAALSRGVGPAVLATDSSVQPGSMRYLPRVHQ